MIDFLPNIMRQVRIDEARLPEPYERPIKVEDRKQKKIKSLFKQLLP